MSDDFFKGRGLDKFKDIGFNFNKESLSQAKFINPQEEITRQIQDNLRKQIGVVNATKRKEEEYKQEVLQTLKGIENNTVGLTEVIPLLSKSIGNQEDILNYLKEALSISASETKEEAVSKWRTVMNKATEVTTDYETVQKLQDLPIQY